MLCASCYIDIQFLLFFSLMGSHFTIADWLNSLNWRNVLALNVVQIDSRKRNQTTATYTNINWMSYWGSSARNWWKIFWWSSSCGAYCLTAEAHFTFDSARCTPVLRYKYAGVSGRRVSACSTRTVFSYCWQEDILKCVFNLHVLRLEVWDLNRVYRLSIVQAHYQVCEWVLILTV